MSKDTEPQNIGNIEQQLEGQRRGLDWDIGIFSGGLFEAYLLTSNMEPGILKAVATIIPVLVTTGSIVMLLHRWEQINYLQGLRDGISQEAQRTATLAKQ